MLTAFLLAALAQAPTMTLTVPIPATVAFKAECRVYSDSRKQWLDLTKAPPVWVNTPSGEKTGGELAIEASNPEIRTVVVPLLEPGTYRFYTRLLVPTSVGGVTTDVPTKAAYSSATILVNAETPPPVVTVTVTQPK